MTREEFISNCVAITGSAMGWQAGIARRLGVDPNTIRKAVKHGPSDNLARAVLEQTGEPVAHNVHARWICGDGDDGREYLVHTRFPRFRCLIVALEDDYDLSADEGVVYQVNDETWLAAFAWIDQRPDGLSSLMEAASDAVESFT